MTRNHWSYWALLASGMTATAIASEGNLQRIESSTEAAGNRTDMPAADERTPARSRIEDDRKGPVTQAVSFAPTSANDLGYFAIRGVERTIEIGIDAALPAASAFSVPIVSNPNLPATTASFAEGEDFATTTVSILSGFEQGAGVYGIELGTPSDGAVGLAPPTSTTLELRTYPATREESLPLFQGKLAGAFCPIECTYFGSSTCGNVSGRKHLSEAKAGFSFPTDFGDFNDVGTLRNFRDNVLTTSDTGNAYIALYDRHGYELGLLLFADPTFFGHFRNAKDAWMPAVDSLVNGDGSAVIDANMIAMMNQAFDHFRTYGSDRLRKAINENYDLLQPGDFEGQTIGELADHWATLPASPEIWGDGFDGP